MTWDLTCFNVIVLRDLKESDARTPQTNASLIHVKMAVTALTYISTIPVHALTATPEGTVK